MSTNVSPASDGDKRKRENIDSSVMRDLCRRAKWEEAEEWLQGHSQEEIKEVLEYRGERKGGFTALCLACLHAAPVPLVRSMISSAPQTLKLSNKYGNLPLHFVAKSFVPVEVMRILVEADQQTLTTKGRWGQTPLLSAIYCHQFVDKKIEVLVRHGAAAIADENGSLPLHLALKNNCPENGLRIILRAFPEAITTKDDMCLTPLLGALHRRKYRNDHVVIGLFLGNGAAAIAGEDGVLPLHQALSMRCRYKIVRIILEAFPEAITKTNHEGQTPLLLAIYNGLTNLAYFRILAANGAATMVEKNGNFPLHVCCLRIR